MATASELLDRREAEKRARNLNFRLRMAALRMAELTVVLILSVVIAAWAGSILQTSARNLAVDIGRAGEVYP